MIRVTVPRPVAEALMPLPCPHVDCEGEGDTHCWGCHGAGALPPTLNLLVVEGYWPPGFVTDDDHPPTLHPEHAQAIEAGERIGIDVECETCEGKQSLGAHLYDPDEYEGPCPNCTNGLVPVGSVRPVRVLPVVGYMRGRVPDAPCIEVVTSNYVSEWYECSTDAPHDRIMHRKVRLSVYGPAESLIGKFAVEVEDARREP